MWEILSVITKPGWYLKTLLRSVFLHGNLLSGQEGVQLCGLEGKFQEFFALQQDLKKTAREHKSQRACRNFQRAGHLAEAWHRKATFEDLNTGVFVRSHEWVAGASRCSHYQMGTYLCIQWLIFVIFVCVLTGDRTPNPEPGTLAYWGDALTSWVTRSEPRAYLDLMTKLFGRARTCLFSQAF